MPLELTRIRNNQIYDATIWANAKIVPGSIVGSLFNSNLTTTSDVTIGGNLTVLGTSTYMTVASTNTYVNDPLIVLNNAFSGTNQYDLGFILNRGVLTNQAIIWDESEDEFRFIGTSEVGTTYGNVATGTFSNVRVGNIAVQYYGTFGATVTVTSGNIDVNYSAGGISTTGNIAINAVNGGSLTTASPTFNLVNANATTVNFAGAATALTIGATSGIATLRNANLWMPNATTVGSGQTTLTLFPLPPTITAFGKASLLTVGDVTGNLVLNNPFVAHTQSSVSLFNSNVTILNGLGAATTVNLGATTGVFQINNPTIAATQSTVNLLNANVTTLNFAGAATDVTIGSTAGTANVRLGNVNFTNATVFYAQQPAINLFNSPTIVNAFTSATTANVGTSATWMNIGATSGTLNLQNPNVFGTQATQNLYTSANTTTMNFALSSANMTIGGTAGTANIRLGNINFTNATTFYAQQNSIAVFDSPATVTAFQGATALTIGATTGLASIRNAVINFPNATSLTTDQATLSLFNANVTTLNAVQAATAITVGATTGLATVRNQVINFPNLTSMVTDQTSINVFDANVTTLNIAGAATTISIGAATGTTTVDNSLQVLKTLYANVSTPQTTANTGAFIVPTGGAWIGGAANIGFTLTVAGATQLNNTLGVGGVTSFTNTTNSTNSPLSGAVQIAGGASISKDLFIGGNLYVSNIFSTGYTLLTVSDPLLYLTASNVFPYNYSIGTYSQFVGPDANTGVGNVYQHSGVVRDHADNTWKFFSNVRSEPGVTVPFDADTIFDPVRAGNLVLTYTQNPLSTTSGNAALRTGGGAVIGGNIFQSGAYLDTSVTGEAVLFRTPATGNLFASATAVQIGAIASATLTTRPGTVVGVNTTQALYDTVATTINFGRTGNITLNAPSGTTTLQGAANIQAATASTNSATGALRVMGGIGVAGNIFQGGAYLDTGATNFILGATPTTVNAFSSGTNIQFGAAAGVFQVRNPNIDTVQTTLNLFTANATAITFASVGNVTMGAPSGVTTVRGGANIQSTTDSTNSATGALRVMGGIGIAGNIFTNSSYLETARTNYLILNTPTTIDAFEGATTLNIGANSGILTLGNPTVVGTQATQALYNTVTSTLNFGGAANINLGHTTGWANVRGSANVQQTVTSTAYNNGALLVQGGVGVRGNLNVKSNQNITVGADIAPFVDEKNIITAIKDANNFARISLQNISSGTQAASEFIAVNNLSSNSSGYIRVGVLNAGFLSGGANLLYPTDSYVTADTANILIATESAGSEVKIAAGGLDTTKHIASFSGIYSNVSITPTTISTSATTGAFTVAGGVGFGSNLNVARGAVINSSAASTGRFQVRGGNDAALIVADPTRDSVVISGQGNTTVQPGVGLKVGGTGAIMIPTGTTGQRPGSAGNVDLDGMIRMNTISNNFEFYINGDWQVAGSSFTLIASEAFTGDGANLNFTLSSSSTTASTIVSINGIVQIPTTSYSVSGNLLTFTEAPAVGDTIDIRKLTTTSTVGQLANGFTVFDAQANWGNIQTGTSSATNRLAISNQGDIWIASGGNVVYNQPGNGVNITANATPYVVAHFNQTQYNTAKYIVQVKNSTTAFQSMEALVLTDQSGNAYVTTYAVVTNGTQLGTLSANVVGNNVNLYYTNSHPNGVNSNVKVQTTLII